MTPSRKLANSSGAISSRQERFAFQLGRTSRRWRTVLDERLKRAGLTHARWTTLLQLRYAGNALAQSELAALVGVEGSTLVRLLDALERQGLIERRPAQADRRVKHVRLTRAARPMLSQINRIAAGLRRELLADASPADLNTCLKVLSRIGKRMERL